MWIDHDKAGNWETGEVQRASGGWKWEEEEFKSFVVAENDRAHAAKIHSIAIRSNYRILSSLGAHSLRL